MYHFNRGSLLFILCNFSNIIILYIVLVVI